MNDVVFEGPGRIVGNPEVTQKRASGRSMDDLLEAEGPQIFAYGFRLNSRHIVESIG
jgi:ATP phosphoribosyltransferase regulatory subunit HisZ